MEDDLDFQQRWGFRRTDDDFDSDDSKSSSGELGLKKHKLVSSLISLDNETSDTSRPQQGEEQSPCNGSKIKSGKAKAPRTRKSKKDSVANSGLRKDSREEVNRKKSRTSAYDPAAAMEETKIFMDSLLQELKVARENLIEWMKEEINKLDADDAAPQPVRKRGNSGRKKAQSLHTRKTKKVVQAQDRDSEQNLQVQNQNNFEGSGQAQHENNIQEIICVEQKENSGKNIKEQHPGNFDENSHMQDKINFRYSTRTQNCLGGPLQMVVKSGVPADSNNFGDILEDQVDYGQVSGSLALAEMDKGKRLASSFKSSFQSSPFGGNVQVQQQKGIVLGIRAQNCNVGSSEKSAGRKRIAESNHSYKVPENSMDYGQAIASIPSSGKDQEDQLGSCAVPSSGQSASMYLTLPSVLTEPSMTNQKLDVFSYIQPRLAGNRTFINSERANQVLDSTANRGYFPFTQPDERIGSFGQMSSRNMNCFDQNSYPASSRGAAFPVLLHGMNGGGSYITGQGYLDNLQQENNNALGVRINGGTGRLTGGGYGFSEQSIAANLHNHPNYKPDGRQAAFQIPNISDTGLPPK